MISSVGEQGLQSLNKTRQSFHQEVYAALATGKTYEPKSPTPGSQNPKPNQPLPVTPALERMAGRYRLTKAMRRFLNA